MGVEPRRFGVLFFAVLCVIRELCVILQPDMARNGRIAALIAAIMMLAAGCRPGHGGGGVDLRLRGRIDSYNKQAFMNRYQNPPLAIGCAHKALRLLRDREAYARMCSAPNPFGDGRASRRIADIIEAFFRKGGRA